MNESESIEKINVAEHARRLTEPFTMIDLVQIDELTLSIYLCEGTLAYHRHLDQDELFLVHSGTISLESDWGRAILRSGELAVAPKAVAHRSSSLLRSTVLLLQPRLMVNRRNGDRRLFVPKKDGLLDKVAVRTVGRRLTAFYAPVTLAHLDTFALQLMVCQGSGPRTRAEGQAALIFCYEGQLQVESDRGAFRLEGGELVVLPSGSDYRLLATRRSLVLGLERHKQPGLPLPD